jgi:glycosyltransferase involved in cell wall biosynthesis
MLEGNKKINVCLISLSRGTETASGVDIYSWQLINNLRNYCNFIPFICKKHQHLKYLEVPLNTLQKSLACRCMDVIHFTTKLVLSPSICVDPIKERAVVTIHDLVPYPFMKSSFYKKYYSFDTLFYVFPLILLAKCAKRVIVPFNIIKEDLIRLGFENKKVKVIRMGVDINKYKPILSLKRANKGKCIILALIKDPKTEGLDVLLQAFQRLLKKGVPAELHVGSTVSYKTVMNMARNYSVPENKIKYLGFIEDAKMPLIYNNASVYVMLQHAGFSLTILEAMACGTPVIATNTEDIKEIVKDEAILVNPFDMEEILYALETILTNERIAEELSLKGIMLARKYTWKKTAMETLSVYREVIEDDSE